MSADIADELVCDPRQGDLGDVQLVLGDQVEQQVKRTFVNGRLNPVVELASEQVFHRREIILRYVIISAWQIN